MKKTIARTPRAAALRVVFSTLFRVGASLGIALLAPAPADAQERYNVPGFRDVSSALVCQCGCNSRVSECGMDRCPSAFPIRDEIAERLQAGEEPDAVIARFADRYGLVILAAPPTSGFHLAAWVFPFVVLAGGGLLVWSVLRRSGGRGPVPVAEPGAAAPPADVARRIEREVDLIR